MKPHALNDGRRGDARSYQPMSTLKRYTLMQIPGWLVAGGILLAGTELQLISSSTAAILFAVWFLKDVVTYPLVRGAYERRDGTVIADLIGNRGTVQRDLAPAGFVRIRGELWRAEVPDHQPAIAAGATVIVHATRGLTLIVAAETEAEDPPSPAG